MNQISLILYVHTRKTQGIKILLIVFVVSHHAQKIQWCFTFQTVVVIPFDSLSLSGCFNIFPDALRGMHRLVHTNEALYTAQAVLLQIV